MAMGTVDERVSSVSGQHLAVLDVVSARTPRPVSSRARRAILIPDSPSSAEAAAQERMEIRATQNPGAAVEVGV